VERLDDGEVSPYLTEVLRVGDLLELRSPIGGHFVWPTGTDGPVQLIVGGSGVAPFLSCSAITAPPAGHGWCGCCTPHERSTTSSVRRRPWKIQVQVGDREADPELADPALDTGLPTQEAHRPARSMDQPSRDSATSAKVPCGIGHPTQHMLHVPWAPSQHVLLVALAFAGGAVLASLADTLMLEAFEHGQPLNVFATAARLFLSFVLAA
jgi:hypothetical protein